MKILIFIAINVCFELKSYTDTFDFLRLELGKAAGDYSENRDLIATPMGLYCSEIDIESLKFARVSTCRRQSGPPGSQLTACGFPSPEMSLVFPAPSTSYQALRR